MSKNSVKINYVSYFGNNFSTITDYNFFIIKEWAGLSNLLTYRERVLLELRLGIIGPEPRTLEELHEMFGVTRERIAQVIKRGTTKIKKYILENA